MAVLLLLLLPGARLIERYVAIAFCFSSPFSVLALFSVDATKTDIDWRHYGRLHWPTNNEMLFCCRLLLLPGAPPASLIAILFLCIGIGRNIVPFLLSIMITAAKDISYKMWPSTITSSPKHWPARSACIAVTSIVHRRIIIAGLDDSVPKISQINTVLHVYQEHLIIYYVYK